MKSDANGTASIGLSNGTIKGNVTVHRFIPAHKAWRFLSVPVNNPSLTIKQAWQEGAAAESDNPNPYYGTQITSETSAWSTLGFDRQSVYPSMKYYNNSTNTYTGITTTNAAFDHTKQGYLLFVRGDRSATTITSPASSTTLRLTGTLYQGTQSPVTIYPVGFTPIANPYAAPVDLTQLDPSHTLFFYVYDPNLGTSYGAFQTLSWNGYNYVPTPGGGSFSLSPTPNPNLIQSGQAFWASGASVPNVTFKESVKTSAYTGAPIFRPGSVAGRDEHIITNLYSITDSSKILLDGTLQQFDVTYKNEVDGMDAL